MSGEKQISKNLIFNLINLIINAFIGILYTPYLINNLGVIAYGIIPLAMVFNQYVSIFSSSLTNTLTRFYAIAFQKKEYKNASQYLTSSFVAVILLISGIGIIAFILVVNFNKIINVPEEILLDAKLLFILTLISLCVSLISSFLNITLYAKNRLDYMNIISLLRNISKVFFVIVLFQLEAVNLKVIGISGLISEVLVLLLSFIYYRKTNEKKISLHFKYFNFQSLSPIIIMTLWLIVHQVGDMGIYKMDLFIVNKFWSIKETSYLGAFSDLGSYIMSLMAVLTSLFGPIILIAFSRDNHKQIKQFIVEISFLVAILSTVIIGILIGFAKPFITLWVGEEFAVYYFWFILKLISIPFYTSAGVFSFIYRSWNFVKFPAVITLFLGIINIIALYFLARYSKGNLQYVDYILVFSSLITFVQTYILGVFMMKQIYKDIKIFSYIKNSFLIVYTLIFIVICCHFSSMFFIIDNWISLFTMSIIIGLFSLLFIYFGILKKIHKDFIFKIIKKRQIV